MFGDIIETVIERGVDCPPGLDFDAVRPGVAPGNLWDPPSAWQDPSPRQAIPGLPDHLEEHPRHAELVEGFCATDYLALNPDLPSWWSPAQAFEHFAERGYAERRPYSVAIWSIVNPPFYAREIGSTGPDGSGLLDESGLRRHYSYHGRFEDRAPNDLTAWIANTRVHLWQMGKVGSLSIQRALREQHRQHSVHLHYVDAYHRDQASVGVHYSRLLNHHGERPKLVVCGVRDPLERVVSGYFQEAESLGLDDGAYGDASDTVMKLASRLLHDLWIICGWFNHRFYCGLDIYAAPFDHDAGFVRLESETVRLFLYKQDRLSGLGAELADFLGVPEISFPRTNISADKPYSEMLGAVGECVRLPERVTDALYRCRYATHFAYRQDPKV